MKLTLMLVVRRDAGGISFYFGTEPPALGSCRPAPSPEDGWRPCRVAAQRPKLVPIPKVPVCRRRRRKPLHRGALSQLHDPLEIGLW